MSKSSFLIPYLYAHQQASVELGRRSHLMADFSDPGTGKTLVQIELMLERDEWPALVVCPKSIMHEVWERQLISAGIKDILILENSSASARAALRDIGNTKVIVINYELVALVLPELMQRRYSVIILDESTRIKTPRARRSKAVMRLRDMATRRVIMTGTPAPNNLLDIFNQIRFLSSEFFGESWFLFRQTYMYQVPWDQFNWYPKKGAPEMIRRRIAHITVQHHKRDCLDLPPIVYERRWVEMTREQAQAYQQMKQHFLLELEDARVITAPFTITRLMKLRQICSGFIYSEDQSFIISKISNKIEECITIIDELAGAQVIVFCHFRATAEFIFESLSRVYKTIIITGETYDKTDMLAEFESGRAQVLVGNLAVLAHGLNLQYCSNIIFYELDFSLENFEQGVQRIERIGQKNKMTVFYLLTQGTLERWILEKLEKKIDLNKQLDINEIKEVLRHE